MQREHPDTYYSKKLSPLRQRASTYAKELWAITDAVQKWRRYLWGNEFTIHTNHWSLKNLLEQTIQTPKQQFFLTKLLGYKYHIEYKKGIENGGANALSRLPTEEEVTSQLRAIIATALPEWVEQLRRESTTYLWLVKL